MMGRFSIARPTFSLALLLLLLVLVSTCCSGGAESQAGADALAGALAERTTSLRQGRRQQEGATDTTLAQPQHEPQQRRLVGFWNMFFLVNVNDHCPPIGKPHDDCVARRSHSHSGGGGSSPWWHFWGGGGGNGGSGGSGGSGGGNGGSGGSSSEGGSSSGGGGSSSGGGGGSGGSSSNSGGGGGAFHASEGGEEKANKRSPVTIAMLIAAAAAVAVALAAVIRGQRNSTVSNHSLKGSVSRRIALFSSIAGTTNTVYGSRPERRIELALAKEEYGKGMKHSLNPNPPMI